MPDYKVFPLPDTAEGLVDAEILTWHIKPGDEVAVNQIIVEIETAKAAVELPCPWAGVVTELHAQPGQTVNVGEPIVTIDVDPRGAAAAPEPQAETNGQAMLVGYGPKASSGKRRARKNAPTAAPAAVVSPPVVSPPVVSPPVVSPPVVSPPVVSPPAVSPPVVSPPVAAPPVPEPITVPDSPAALLAPAALVPLAKPPVRKLAKDLGVDLRSLAASGVITREDVERAAQVAAAPVVPTGAAQVVPAGARERRVPVKGVRKMTAQAMVESAYSAPHVTEFLTVDVTPMMELRARLKAHPAFRDVKITPLTFAAKAVCLAVKRTPDVNATWAGEEIVYKDYVHLGIAAATPRGLVVPKVRDADAMSLRDLAVALEQLTATAREGRTTPADMVNGTFTITNVGVFGVDTGTPIINPGESAILALGAIRDMPWVVDGEIRVRKVCQLSLSFDHRVIDGQQGSQFLADVGAILADPAMAITF